MNDKVPKGEAISLYLFIIFPEMIITWLAVELMKERIPNTIKQIWKAK